jgi:S1-C subfamily serine protease
MQSRKDNIRSLAFNIWAIGARGKALAGRPWALLALAACCGLLVSAGPRAFAAADAPVAAPPAEAPAGPTTLPAAPAWMAQPTAQWPQVLLEPDILFKDKTKVQGASGFLMRLPNKVVVAATARHVIGEQVNLETFDASFTSFFMHAPAAAGKKVGLRKLVLKPGDAKALDAVLMTVTTPGNWPVEVRPARATPAAVGETVYLLAVPDDEHSAQNVYKGVVQRREGDSGFAYDFADHAEQRGFSGAPILDAQGNIVGMHLGSISSTDGKTFRHAVDASALVNACTVPGAAQAPGHAAAAAAATDAPSSSGPKESAHALLNLGDMYLAAKREDLAVKQYHKVIDQYPGTPEAAKAQELLAMITPP